MPRHARLHSPGALVHAIIRFVNREHRLADAADRSAFLARIPPAMSRSDWTLHAYALMSNHVHLAFTAGEMPIEGLLKSLLVSVAHHLNKSQNRLGPLVSERATTIVAGQPGMARLVAYLHNNPVRAGIALDASTSDRTSHRAWIGVDPTPPWLAVTTGLRMAGFDTHPRQRVAFDSFVRSRAGKSLDAALVEPTLSQARVAARSATALPIEIASPTLQCEREVASEMRYAGVVPVNARWHGDLGRLVDSAARRIGQPAEAIRSRAHSRDVVVARRAVMVAGVWLLRRQVNEVAAALSIADSSGSRLLRRGAEVLPLALAIAELLRTGSAG